jgi:hypothetical protein
MTNQPNQPDQAARWLSHALVGLAAVGLVTLCVSRRHSPEAQIIGALLAVALHEMLDAPVATALGDVGL